MNPLENLPVLYSFRRCPYAMRARLALQVSGVTCVLREIELKNKPAEMLAASPKGTVPVLVLPSGQVLEQSLDIMHFALAHGDPLRWLGSTESERVRQDAWVARNDTEFKCALDRFKYPQRFGLTDNTEYRAAGNVFLHGLDEWLQHHTALSGSRFGFADAAIAPFVRQWAHADPAGFAAQPWARLQIWLQAFESSDLFLATMQKYAAWRADDLPVFFPSVPL